MKEYIYNYLGELIEEREISDPEPVEIPTTMEERMTAMENAIKEGLAL